MICLLLYYKTKDMKAREHVLYSIFMFASISLDLDPEFLGIIY